MGKEKTVREERSRNGEKREEFREKNSWGRSGVRKERGGIGG
jgi:hypothetical protein